MGFRVRSLQRGEVDDLLACFQAAFGVDDSSLAIVRNSLVNDPYFLPERIRVGVLDGRVVSHVVILHRAFYAEERVVSVAGVTAVATDPAYQGRGFGTRVMQDAARIIRERGYDMALLTTRLPRFFARFGFREVPRISGYACPASALARLSVDSLWSLERIDYSQHWRALAGVYHQYSYGRTGLQVRDERFWESWPRRGTFPHGFSAAMDAMAWMAVRGDQVLAYTAAHCAVEDRHLSVTELAHLPGCADAALALLRLVGESFCKGGSGRAILQVGGSAPVLDLLREQRVPVEVEVGPGLMVWIPNRGWLRDLGLRSVDDAVERLFRPPVPVLWQRDGF